MPKQSSGHPWNRQAGAGNALSRKKIVKKLDMVFSLFVRKRDGRCVTCTNLKRLPLTNGHLFSRVAFSTRWDELNCHCQCTGCNLYHEHDSGRFTTWFLRKFGQEKYELLYASYNHTAKYTSQDLMLMIKDYEARLV